MHGDRQSRKWREGLTALSSHIGESEERPRIYPRANGLVLNNSSNHRLVLVRLQRFLSIHIVGISIRVVLQPQMVQYSTRSL
jgi:hypothetical protein